jgi:Fur family ferric uptake transcriptional regulator
MAVLDDDTLDRATIYRNLSDLTEAGLLQRLDLGDHVWRFEPAPAAQPHHEGQHPHFVCTDCGAVQCLDDVEVSLRGPSVPRSVAQASVRVQLTGQCDDCGDATAP